ncbi:hypothetical protein [Halomonas litopenaei]|uniref:hypothetical protein n=1 Tax=Halomonas litopenaei TaxID=2109328 RepID=UPI001A8D5378|nr:hypothetical protein [Halomonas litopenaei]MBN8412999.1 hypothetical protein [Halomonas litopenaei]
MSRNPRRLDDPLRLIVGVEHEVMEAVDALMEQRRYFQEPYIMKKTFNSHILSRTNNK